MAFFDFLKGNNSHGAKDANNVLMFRQLVKEAEASKTSQYSNPKAFATLASYKHVSALSAESKVAFTLDVIRITAHGLRNPGDYWTSDERYGVRLLPHLFNQLEFTGRDFVEMALAIKAFSPNIDYRGNVAEVAVALAEKIEERLRQQGHSPDLQRALEALIVRRVDDYFHAAEVRQHELVTFLLDRGYETEVDKQDAWGTAAIAFLNNCDQTLRKQWLALFAHASQGSGSTPTQKWMKQADPMVRDIGHERFARTLGQWLEMLRVMLQAMHAGKGAENSTVYLRERNHEIVKALIWSAGLVNDRVLHRQLDEYAAMAYKKKPGVGPISARTGTAAMFAFSQLPIKEGVSRLSKFRMKIKNNTLLKAIDKQIRAVADKHKIGLDEIEELSLPDFNISRGEYRVALGDYTGRYTLADGNLWWERNGKPFKGVPQDVSRAYASELKAIKSDIKEIESLLPVIKGRLEQSYLRRRTWRYTDWLDVYHEHPLASFLSRKFVWHFRKGEQRAEAFFLHDKFVDVNGMEVAWLDADTTVELWHPIGFTAEQILGWRRFLVQHHVVQPFKQAHREVYILTDAEVRTDVYSNRFAAHVLRQHQFSALCSQRGWRYRLMGAFDSHNTPYIDFPAWGIGAEFFVNADWSDAENDVSPSGIYNYISTDQVRFIRDAQSMHLHDVPALFFSEIMRDVDLFVGVTSIGNDPNWVDGGNNFQNAYWQGYSFSELSESAKVRSQVLQELIPQLKIAPQCTFDKKFLIVKGKLRTYKIHMGSGNILMEPDDQYLCIVPEGRRTDGPKVFLPFEGDTLLSIIISKALLLASDNTITDQTILHQINR